MYVQYGESCLHLACERGYLSIVKHLGACGGEELLMLQKKVAVYTDVYYTYEAGFFCACVFELLSKPQSDGRA